MAIYERLTRDLRFLKSFGRALPNVIRSRPTGTFTVADAIGEVAQRMPEQLALVFEDQKLTYRNLDLASNQVAHWAKSHNIGRGDVVALLMGNRPEFVVYWLGLAKLGAVTALINTNLTGRPLAHCLELSGAKHLILDAALAGNYANAENETNTTLTVWSSGGDVPGAEDLDSLRAKQPERRLPPDTREGLTAGDKLFYIYTSGTTGLPKAANFSHQKFIATSSGGLGISSIGPSDRMYIVLPLYHSAGGVMALGATLLSGATAVLARKFSATRFWEDCVNYDVTMFQYIGELCRYLLNSPVHPDERKHSLRVCIGNGLRPEIWEPFQDRFAIPRIIEFYGATEGNIALMNIDNKVGSIGRMPTILRRAAGLHVVQFDVENEEVIRETDGFCIPCATHEAGEAIAKISKTTRFEGYTDESASEKKILRDVFEKGDAYFRSGDLLRMDEEDYFYFVDRIGDTFRWKGENVSTGEVSEVVTTCSGIREVNVYGVEVPGTDGRAGMASLVLDDDFDLEVFHTEVCSQLAAYARPLFLRIRSELEITGTFKHRKVEAVKEGFDPALVADPLYVLDARQSAYVGLTAEIYRQIQNGDMRL
jgi:fatty-acyl-CoA synthase